MEVRVWAKTGLDQLLFPRSPLRSALPRWLRVKLSPAAISRTLPRRTQVVCSEAEHTGQEEETFR